MPDRLDEDIQRSVGYKHALGQVNTDIDKSVIEEKTFTAGYITDDEILISDIPFNDPEAAIASGVISSGTLVMTPDLTVGGEYRAYTSPKIPVSHPAKHGNEFAPMFFHSSGTLINKGDLFDYSVFYYEAGKLVITRNDITDEWKEPILIDGFFYEGQTLDDIDFDSFASKQDVIQVSGDLQTLENKVDNLTISGSPVNMRFGYVTGDTFTGRPLSRTVSIAPAYDTNELSIQLTPTLNRHFYVEPGYTSGSFTIVSSSNRPMTSNDRVMWAIGEIF